VSPADTGIAAAVAAAAAAHDPQMRPPARPRVREGLVRIPVGGGLLVEGTPTPQLLRGRSAATVLPLVLDHLDGQRDVTQLAAATGLGSAVVGQVVALLHACGAVEEGPPPGPAPDIAPHLRSYLSRVSDSTRAVPRWEDAAARLRTHRVQVVGSGPFAAALRDQSPVPLAPALPPARPEGPGLVILVEEQGGDAAADATARAAWAASVPLLRFGLHGDVLDVGPYVDPAATACLECSTAVASPGDGPGDGPVAPPADAVRELAAAVAAAELLALVSRAVPSSLPMTWRQIDLTGISTRRHTAASRPGCPLCSAAGSGEIAEPSPGARFEASVAFPARAFIDTKAHQQHYKPGNLALQRDERRWPVPARVLPTADVAGLAGSVAGAPAPPPQAESGTLTREHLALLLAAAVGHRPEQEDPMRVSRWTATGGNLGSPQAYLVARRIPGLDPGLYGYVPSSHELALLRSDPQALPPAAVLEDADATVVLAGSFSRVAGKYGPFALRVVLLDSGCALAVLRTVARALAVPLRRATRWDDAALGRAFAFDPHDQIPTGVVHLGRLRPSDGSAPGRPRPGNCEGR